MSKKRQMWIQVCVAFAVLWGVLSLLIWPFLFLALCSVLMILIPVGISDEEKAAPRHDAEAWRRNTK